MAVSVLLDLRNSVSVPVLSYLPEDFDANQDLRTSIDAGGMHLLEIHLPLPETQE